MTPAIPEPLPHPEKSRRSDGPPDPPSPFNNIRCICNCAYGPIYPTIIPGRHLIGLRSTPQYSLLCDYDLVSIDNVC